MLSAQAWGLCFMGRFKAFNPYTKMEGLKGFNFREEQIPAANTKLERSKESHCEAEGLGVLELLPTPKISDNSMPTISDQDSQP